MKKRYRGQTLIEVITALSVSVIVVSAITAAVVSALNNAEFGENESNATNYAQQAMEVMRIMRDDNYTTFSSLENTYCLASTCTSLDTTAGDACGPQGTTCGQNVGIFDRQVSVFQNSSDCDGVAAKITATVSWADSKCQSAGNPLCHNVTLTSCLANSDVVPTP